MSKFECTIIDMDHVLVDSDMGYTAISNRVFGTHLDPVHYTEDWAAWWGISDEEVSARNKLIWQSCLLADFQVLPDAKEGVAMFAERGPVKILTSRHLLGKVVTEALVEQEFGNYIEGVYFSGAYDLGFSRASHALTKGGQIIRLGGTRFIEDLPKHCNAAAERGVETIKFGNRFPDLPLRPEVVELPDWRAVINHFSTESTGVRYGIN